MFPLRFSLTIHHIATAPYETLALSNLVYRQWVVSHVLQGCVQTETRGVRATACAGDVMIHPPHLPFSEYADAPGTHQWMAVTAQIGEPHRDFLAQYPLPLCVPLNAHSDAYIADFEHLSTCHDAPDTPLCHARAVALGASLLHRLITAWEEGGATTLTHIRAPQGRFADLVTFMSEHLHEPIGRDELARVACLHPGSLDRAFRACHGVAPMQMLRSLRLERARRLLETTDRTLEFIASQVGLGDAARFSRVFRSQFGMAPGSYRSGARQAKTGYI